MSAVLLCMDDSRNVGDLGMRCKFRRKAGLLCTGICLYVSLEFGVNIRMDCCVWMSVGGLVMRCVNFAF